MRDVLEDFVRTVEEAAARLLSLTEDEARVPLAEGKWSAKEVVGHLIDSASNNHQRFVRAQEVDRLVFPPYEQNHWSASQHCNDRGWSDLIALWHAYNAHLAHVIPYIPDGKLAVQCVIEHDHPVTLEYLVTDYVVHLRHHLDQIFS